MFLVMGITGKAVQVQTARHLLAQGQKCRPWSAIAIRRRTGQTKAWKLVWMETGTMRQPSPRRAQSVVEARFVMLPARYGRSCSLDFEEAKEAVIANYVEAALTGHPRRVVISFVDVARQKQRAGADHGLIAFGARFSQASSLRSHLCVQADSSKTFFTAYRLAPKAERCRSFTILQTANRQ